jgi:phytol kinase
MAFFENPWIASIGPASFIVINAVDARLHLLPGLSGGGDARHLGTVWFPVSLLLLVNLCWRGLMAPWVGGVGVLVMGWGDGLAAVVGDAVPGPGLRIWGGRKTLAGSAAMFTASFAVTLAFTLLFHSRAAGLAPASASGAAAATAAAATAVEALTPFGLDNLSVPLATSLFYAAVFL